VVTEDGLKVYFSDGDTPRPHNAWTGEPMKPGTQRGDSTYKPLNGGAHYRLAGHVSTTQDCMVP
jgi:hypothetical protein